MNYVGHPDGQVFVGLPGSNARKPLDPQLKLRNHSPTGFAWGYNGSGPAQLALAILVEHFKARPPEALQELLQGPPFDEDAKLHERLALQLYQDFKSLVIARFPQDTAFTLTEEQVEVAVWMIVQRRSVSEDRV